MLNIFCSATEVSICRAGRGWFHIRVPPRSNGLSPGFKISLILHSAWIVSWSLDKGLHSYRWRGLLRTCHLKMALNSEDHSGGCFQGWSSSGCCPGGGLANVIKEGLTSIDSCSFLRLGF
eukprot:6439005-Amphidinium_carterae.2